MQVTELVELARFLKEFIQDRQLANQYQQLIAAVNQAAQNQNPQNVQVQFDRLMSLHRAADAQVLSPTQNKLLSDYGADKLLGMRAAERLVTIFQNRQAHPQGLTSDLQSLLNETNELVVRADQLIKILTPMLAEVDADQLGEGEGRLWLFFANAASVDTIEDLGTAAETWKQSYTTFLECLVLPLAQPAFLVSRSTLRLKSSLLRASPFSLHWHGGSSGSCQGQSM